MSLQETWRWYGPTDPVSLADAKQAGATGIVTALHHIPNGEIWPVKAILERKATIEAAGLYWAVVESVPVHEDIKRRSGNYLTFIDNYKKTLINLGRCGIGIVCYNFMPVLDWTRTDLDYPMPDGATALRFNAVAFAAFDLFILARPDAAQDYPAAVQHKARIYFEQLPDSTKQQLTRNIIAGLPGAEEGYQLSDFLKIINSYQGIGRTELKTNLFYFLRNIVPVAEEADIRLCIHPDDPPYPILGLPRVVSTEKDIEEIYQAADSYYNGLTFCTGSFGVRPDNDLAGMVQRLGHRIHFAHLRNTSRSSDGSFHEANHLGGDADMYGIVKALLEELYKRTQQRKTHNSMPFRPDHGHKMLDDLAKKTNPGYSAIGRLRGLAELRGLILGIRRAFNY